MIALGYFYYSSSLISVRNLRPKEGCYKLKNLYVINKVSVCVCEIKRVFGKLSIFPREKCYEVVTLH